MPRQEQRPRQGWAVMAGLTALAILYSLTLLPGPGYSGDTVKFQFLGRVLGTSHATGYPTYIVLNHLFDLLIPFGSAAFKANLLSSLFSLGSAYFVYRCCSVLAVREWVGILVMLGWGMLPVVWTYSIVAEVYSLHWLWISATALCFLTWIQTRSDRSFLAGWALYAFSFGHHLTAILLLPALLWVCVSGRRWLRWRLIWPIGLFFAVSACQYLYIVWRTADPSTPYLEMQLGDFESVWWWLTGAQFKGAFLGASAQEVVHRLRLLAPPVSILLAAAAAFGASRCSSETRWFLLLLALSNLFFALTYAVPDFHSYLQPTFMAVLWLAAVAIEDFCKRWRSRRLLIAGILGLVVCLEGAAASGIVRRSVHQGAVTRLAAEQRSFLDQLPQGSLILEPRYDRNSLMHYYLLAECWRDRAGIHLDVHPRFDLLSGYLRRSEPYMLIETRTPTPPGLRVFACEAGLVQELRERGFAAQPFNGCWELGPGGD